MWFSVYHEYTHVRCPSRFCCCYLYLSFVFHTVAAHPRHLYVDRGACGQCHCANIITTCIHLGVHKLICHRFIPSVFLDAADIWCRFVHTILDHPHFDSLFVVCVSTNWVFPLLSQRRGHVACSCMLTCSKKITSPERGYCCSRKTTWGTWGSNPKVTSCTWRQGIVNHCPHLSYTHNWQDEICSLLNLESQWVSFRFPFGRLRLKS